MLQWPFARIVMFLVTGLCETGHSLASGSNVGLSSAMSKKVDSNETVIRPKSIINELPLIFAGTLQSQNDRDQSNRLAETARKAEEARKAEAVRRAQEAQRTIGSPQSARERFEAMRQAQEKIEAARKLREQNQANR